MPPKRDITRYSSYFTIQIPDSVTQIFIILIIGAVAGMISSTIAHYNGMGDLLSILLLGASSGILIISIPAFLTVLIIRMMKRDMKTKHALFAVLAVSITYSLFIIADVGIYSVLHSGGLAYVILLLGNASIYGYWFIINRIAVGQKRSAILTAEIQPILNVLLFFPFGGYLLKLGVPITLALIKLYFGMFVFLVMGYVIIYLLDMPARARLSVSSVEIFSAMIGQWLYDITADTKVLGTGGIKRDIEVDIVTLSANGRNVAVMVRPDIHYGPFGNLGGSIFTEVMSDKIVSKYGASPFIIHSAVNIEDNPVNTNQVYVLADMVCNYVDKIGKDEMKSASGYVGYGKDKPCRAIDVRMNDVNLLILSKAPAVTEDIDREVGLKFRSIANRSADMTILIDAHNSRFESAPPDELKGIYELSRYIPKYNSAIQQAVRSRSRKKLKFGAAHVKLLEALGNADLGQGYSSVGLFDFEGSMFGMIYIDANNMLPGFRSDVVEHVKKKYRIDVELCTTDTHAVNSIAMSARNALGRYTASNDMMPMLDAMIEKAINNMAPVKMARGTIKFEGFKVWGKGSEDLLNKVGMDIIWIGKRIVPIVIVSAYIIAAWIIYII